MKILVITDLYPVKEDEIHTPRTIEAFIKAEFTEILKILIIFCHFLVI